MSTVAYTMGNKDSYDRALSEEPTVTKIGRTSEYSGGCCWPTYEEADAWIKTKRDIPYTPQIYALILLNGWDEDTSDDTYKEYGYYSLLTDSDVKHFIRIHNEA